MRRPILLMCVLLLLGPVLSASVWYKENLAYGLRDAILLHFTFAPSDPETYYLTTTDGYVFSTHNAGLSWQEARIIVKGKPFFGAIRPERAPSGVAISAEEKLSGSQSLGHGRYRLMDLFYFDYGTLSGELDVLESGLAFKPYDPVDLPNYPSPGGMSIHDRAAGGGGGGAGASKLGVGLKTGAPRLKGALRTMGAPSVGANLQQLLVEMGVEPTWVNHLDVHPKDANTAIAATSMGTYRTTDGGVGWLPIFAGTNRWERDGQHVRYDPLDSNRVYLGTQNGLFISDNGGDRFERVSGTMLESAYVTWLEPMVTTDGEVWLYAGSAMGGFLSRDGGRNWKWIFYETLPDANWISSIAVDRQDPRHALFATWDGMFVTFDAGANWERAGGLMFTATYVPRILVDPEDGTHAFACSEKNIWETRDGGRTWSVIYVDNGDWKIRSMELDPHEKGTLWVVTSGEILRLRNYRAATTRNEREAVFREVFAREPSETTVMMAAFDNLHVNLGAQGAYRQRARLAALLPSVRAVGGYFDVDADAGLDLVALQGGMGLDDLDHSLASRNGYAAGYVAVMAWWDLSGMVFDFDQLSFGRIFGSAMATMYSLKFEMARYYNERIRLMRKLIVEPPATRLDYLEAALRFRELTEHLNALTGGLYDEMVTDLQQGGVEWLHDTL